MTTRNYAFQAAWKRRLARGIDALGDWLAPSGAHPEGPGERLLVSRLDHLGDVITAVPLIHALAGLRPKPFLAIAVSPAARALLRDTEGIDLVLGYDAPWFRRGPAGPQGEKSVLAFWREVRDLRFDTVLEPRGDARHLFLWRAAGIPRRIGYGNTGGGFLLTRELGWTSGLPAVEQNMALLDTLGVARPSPVRTQLDWRATDEERAWVGSVLDVRRRALIIHAQAGTAAKRWPNAQLKAFLEVLPADTQPVLVGASANGDPAVVSALRERNGRDLTGKTSFPQLIALLQAASAVLSTDSGPAQIAAALGRPTCILWSGTSRPEVWAPRGEHVRLLQHHVACEYCALTDCPVSGHPCMAGLAPEAAAAGLLALTTGTAA